MWPLGKSSIKQLPTCGAGKSPCLKTNPFKSMSKLSHADLLQLKRWNTPTIYNGWEQITKRDLAADGFNLEETRDFMPQMGQQLT